MEIRIAKPPESVLEKFAKHEQDFYFKYANIVKTILDMPEVQKTLSVMAKKESLDLEQIRDVRVMMFPHGSTDFESKHIKYLGIDPKELACLGTYNSTTGTISIYPAFTGPEKNTSIFLTGEIMISVITLKTVGTFFEEILHTKYNGEYMKKMHLTLEELEKKVLKIADKYTTIFVNNSGVNK